MSDRECFELILKEARKTSKKIKVLFDGKGKFEDPVDIDIVKTLKAMCYENIVEILKKRKGET